MITLDPSSPDYIRRAEQDRLGPPDGSWPMTHWTKAAIIEEAARHDIRATEILRGFSLEDLRFLFLQYEDTYLTGSASTAGGMRHTRYYELDLPTLREVIRVRTEGSQ